MTQAKIKLFIVDRDSIFRLGLRTAIARYADFEIVGEGNLSEDTLRELTQGIVLNVLVLGIPQDDSGAAAGMALTKQLRELYPQLPLFLLTPRFSARQVAQLQAWGVKGNCDRSASIYAVVEGLQAVAYGNSYWDLDEPVPKLWQQILGKISLAGRIELAQTLAEIEAKLANPNLSDWERVFLVGRRRELQSAKWLSSRLVAEEIALQDAAIESVRAELVPLAATQLAVLPEFAESANKTVFERVAREIQLGLQNRTQVLLEIELLQTEVQKSLCCLILQRLSETVAQIPIANTLEQDYRVYLQELWQWSTENFFMRHYGSLSEAEQSQLTATCERELAEIEANILHHIYGVPELFAYLLGQPGVQIDNIVYQSDTSEAIARIEFLLHNLILHLANAVTQTILNNFYDLETFKYQLYQPALRSDRQLARFRNQLSWRYRLENYVVHPRNIFESRHRLFVLTSGVIRTSYIYAPRQQELEELRGIPWLATMAIEIRDAIAPLVRQAIALGGSGVVFVLTQVVGKGLGLIGKGIIQGIGSTIKDIPHKQKKP